MTPKDASLHPDRMTSADQDKYRRAARLVESAGRVADERAGNDPFSRWATVGTSITLAAIHNEPQADEGAVPPASCAALLREALQLLDDVEQAARRSSHALDRSYVATALTRVEELGA